MNLVYIGKPTDTFFSMSWPKRPGKAEDVPLFDIDGLFVFADPGITEREKQCCQLVERSGRPVMRVGPVDIPLFRQQIANILMISKFEPEELESCLTWFAHRPRTNYRPISCNFYDRFEAAILSKQAVKLEYRLPDGSDLQETVVLKDMKTDKSEEYVQLENTGWVRLDRIVSVEGKPAGDSCRY